MRNIILFAALSIFASKLFAQTLKPTKTECLLLVDVINEKNKSQGGESVTFVSQKTGKAYSGVTADTGKFYILIPKNDKYKVQYKRFTEEKEYTKFEIPEAKDTLLSFEFTIKYELPKVYTLDNVFFDTGKSTLRIESYKELNELAEFMKLKKTLKIEIAGHTDNVGDDAANMKLSQERANSCRDYIIKKGVNAERVSAKGYGETQPAATNDTDTGKQKNRRTEVRIIKE